MDRKLYEKPFTVKDTTDWQCPTCEKGLLRIKEGTFFYKELFESKKAKAISPDDWEPDWNEYTYSCLLQCSNNKCKEIVSNVGKGYVTEYVDYNERYLTDHFEPKFFYPHLKIIKIPKDTPESVTEALNKSFELFFCSPSAASNHVRSALELLLTELKVKRFAISKKGKRQIINLHDRIELLPDKYKEFKDLFLAIKWLGNVGSHNTRLLKPDDVMDAYEIVENLLAEIYDRRTSKVKSLAKKINTTKGPKK